MFNLQDILLLEDAAKIDALARLRFRVLGEYTSQFIRGWETKKADGQPAGHSAVRMESHM